MEELQSTEALDREILDDARKKAFKILKTADEDAAASNAAWDGRLEKTLKEVEDNYRKKEDVERREIMARLPMDRRRVRSEKIEGFLNDAMANFLASLDREKILALLEKELKCRLEACREAGGPGTGEASALRYRGLESAEFENLAAKELDFSFSSKKEDDLFSIRGKFPAVVLDFPSLRITASVDRAAESLLLEKRAELAEALIGRAAFSEEAVDETALSGAVHD